MSGWFGKTNPYLVFYRQRSDKTWLKVHETEVVKGSLNPVWKSFDVKAALLCSGNYDIQIKGELRHYIKGDTDKTIGEF